MKRFYAFVKKKNPRILRNTKLSFTKGSLLLLTFLLLIGIESWGQVTLYSTNFGITAGSFPVGWTSSNITNGFAAVTTSPSTGYTGVSGSVNSRFINTGSNGVLHTLIYSNSLSTIGYSNITVIWGARATSTFTQPVTFEWSIDGSVWNAVTYTQVVSNGSWALVNGGNRINLPVGTEGATNLRFRFTITSNNNGNYQIDDFSVQGTVSSPTTNGTISPGEYGTHTNGNNQQSSATGTWYMKSDATNLYIGIAGTNTAEGAVLYLDKNPIVPVNGGTDANGNLTGNNYDGSNFANLPFRADLVVYFKDGYQEYRTSNGSGSWSGATTTGMNYASLSGTREIMIPWSAIGGQPTAYNWFGYVAYFGGGAYASVPTENPGSGGGTIIGTSARWERYYTVSTSSTMPFSRNSYTFTSASDINSFGPITAYDFTMNTSGRYLSRTGNTAGNWVIGGNLTVGNGTIYLGSGGGSYGTTSVTGNLNLLGGTFDMDQTTGAVAVAGNIDIAMGATLKLSGTAGGDLAVAGNWTNSGTFTPNNRAVTFNGTGIQTITNASGETFNYLTVAGSGTLKLVTGTNITVNATDGLSLSSSNTTSTIDLNGQTITLTGGGNLNLNTGNRFITSTLANGVFKIGANTTSVINPGTLTLDNKTTLLLDNGSFNCGTGAATTINGILQINANGYITGNTPRYGVLSLLKYNSGGTYNRNFEWNGTTVPIGVPDNVQISNNTTLNYVNPANLGEQKIVYNLTIDVGSSLLMDNNSAVSCGGPLVVGNSVICSGNLKLGSVIGDDLKLGGNFTNTGSFNGNNRAIFFTKVGTQIVTSAAGITIPYVVLSGGTTVQLATVTNAIISAPLGGNAISFTNNSDVIDINSNTLTIGTAGIASVISGSGTFKGSITSNLTLLGTGSIGTLSFTTGSQILGNFTINRTTGNIACVLGSPLSVNGILDLTNGIVDLASHQMIITLAGSISNASASNYIIADKTAGGSLRKNLNATGSFTFPIGDSTISADGTQYCPAIVNITAGNFSSAYVTVNVDDAKEPNIEADTDYITRYWNLTGSGITTATYDFTGTYLNVDKVGNESNYLSGRYNVNAATWKPGLVVTPNTVSMSGLTTNIDGAITNEYHYTAGHPFRKAEINIKQSVTDYVHNSTYDFGNVELGTFKEITFTIQNLGLENLNLGAASISGSAYSLITNYTSPVSGPTGTTTFVIRLTPTSLNTFTGSISIPHNDNSGSENPYIINFTGIGTSSKETDIITASGEATTVSSLENVLTISSTSDGVQVWQFTIREGGADLTDSDNLPSILIALTISNGSGNQVGTWNDAIQSVGLFDGNTLIANGTVSLTGTQIQFTGLNVIVVDNTSKTLTLRLSLKNPLGADAFDGEDFVFSIDQTEAVFSPTSSGDTTFTAFSTNGLNVIEVIATKLTFTVQPSDIGQGSVMIPFPQVSATDANGNVDKDFTGSIGLASGGTMTVTTPVTAVAGTATFTNIIHTALATDISLTASSTGLISATSTLFDVLVQTVLQAGDLAVVAVNTEAESSGSSDEITFVCFEDIIPGTQIFFTDNGFERITAGLWGNTEGIVSITRTSSVLDAGTFITIHSNNGGINDGSDFVIYTCGAPDSNWLKNEISTNGSFDLNKDDQVWFMQGGSWTNINTNNHDSSYSGNVLYGWTDIPWETAPNYASTKGSTIYPGLRCFTTDVNNTQTGASRIKFNDNFTAVDRDHLDWIALINNPSNWVAYDTDANYDTNGFNYIGSLCPGMIINADSHFSGVWTGRVNENWFDCSNWDNLKVPNETVDVLVKDNANNFGAKVESTALYANLYGNIAKTKNMNITGEKVILEANANNKLEVHGNLTISNTGTGMLDMDDGNNLTADGQLYVYGNWDNQLGAAAFEEGNGTVHLMGTTVQDVNAASRPETFYNLTIDNPSAFTTDNFHSDLIANGNFELKNGADLTVKTGHYALAGKNLTVGVGSDLIIEDDASLVQTDDTGVVTNNGTTTVLKTTTPYVLYDYTYWSSPINNETFESAFAVNPNHKYKFAAQNFEDRYDKTATGSTQGWPQTQGSPDGQDDTGDDWAYVSGSMVPGTGYIVMGAFANAGQITGQTVTFTETGINGKLNNGVITASVSKDFYNLNSHTGAPTYNTNTNLLGNPYPSAISLDELVADNIGKLGNTFYFWTHHTAVGGGTNTGPYVYNFTSDDYATINVSTGAVKTCVGCLTPIEYVASAQSFMAEYTGNDATSTIVFNNSQRVIDKNTTFFRTTGNSKDRIWLNAISPSGDFRQILVGFIEKAEDNYDSFDSYRLANGSNFDFYSTIAEAKDPRLAIQGLSGFEINKTVSLGIEITTAGTYYIEIDHTDGIFTDGQSIYLEDKYQNVIHDFANGAYSFYSNVGDNINDRFVLRFTNTTLSINDTTLEHLLIYPNPSEGIFNLSYQGNEPLQIELYDLLGKKLESKTIIHKGTNVYVIDLSGYNTGIYFAKITSEGKQVTRKLVVE